jgi:predicted transcriptional regulator
MKYHPYSEIWPLLDGEDFEKLKADIKANGLRLPILIYKDQVLDGRNRDRACEATGTARCYTDAGDISETQALDLVISLNDHRRHMSIAQRAFAAEKLATLQGGSNRYQKRLAGSREPATEKASFEEAAAKIGGVSHGSVKRARIIRAHGTDNDINDVLSGKTSLKTRAEELLARKRKPAATALKPRQSNNRDRVIALYKGPPLKSMTPQEVDPEFTGTPMEFTDKYGHVQIMTAEQYATMRFGEWASWMRSLAKRGREMPPLPERPVDHNWLRSPKSYDIVKLTEALDYLRPKIAEAEALLVRAKAAAKIDTATATTALP